jgi:hypothetical protein
MKNNKFKFNFKFVFNNNKQLNFKANNLIDAYIKLNNYFYFDEKYYNNLKYIYIINNNNKKFKNNYTKIEF